MDWTLSPLIRAVRMAHTSSLGNVTRWPTRTGLTIVPSFTCRPMDVSEHPRVDATSLMLSNLFILFIQKKKPTEMVSLLISCKKKPLVKTNGNITDTKKACPDGQTSDYGKSVAKEINQVNTSNTNTNVSNVYL